MSGTSIANFPVSALMVKNVKTLREGQTILDACKVMHQNNIGSVVIVKESAVQSGGGSLIEPVGIITERDIVNYIATKLIGIQAPIGDAMSKPLVTVRPEASLADAIQIMQSKDFRRLVIVNDKGSLAGIVTDKDVFRVIARNQALLTDLLGQQALPSADTELLEQLRTETLGELFRPTRAQ